MKYLSMPLTTSFVQNIPSGDESVLEVGSSGACVVGTAVPCGA